MALYINGKKSLEGILLIAPVINGVVTTTSTLTLPALTGAKTNLIGSGTALTTGADGGTYDLEVEGSYQSNTAIGNVSIYSNDAQAADKGASIVLGGKYTSNNNVATFGKILVGKDNSTSGEYGGYMAFLTRANGSPPVEALRITSAGNLVIGSTACVTSFGPAAVASITVKNGLITAIS